ncbi:hypothetical protein ACFVH6_04170 [Spirillospora sp. NPDC127200]
MITTEHVARLLAAEDPETALVVVGGRAEIVPKGEETGGLLVTDRRGLVDRLGGDDPSPEALERVAQALDAAVAELGG